MFVRRMTASNLSMVAADENGREPLSPTPEASFDEISRWELTEAVAYVLEPVVVPRLTLLRRRGARVRRARPYGRGRGFFL